MKHQLRTTIDIDATPGQVWQILTDLESYADWSPFIVEAAGTVRVGERLKNRMQSPGRKAMTFRPKVTVVDPGRTFEWLGYLGLPGLFDGRHRFELEPIASGTRVMQSESFRGILVRLLRKSLDTSTRAGFETMNEALAERAATIAMSDSAR